MELKQLSLFEKQEMQIDKPIRLIELFAGYGSQAMALENIGADFETYKVVEFDKYAVKSYNVAHGTNFSPADITKTSGTDLEINDVDKYSYIMTYSFPCQDLSIAGNQKGMVKGSNTRSGLLWEVERLLNEVNNLPQVLLMENVSQVHSKKNIEDFMKWIDFLESKGYKNYWQDINAKNYGVAQNRKRCFMVSVLGDYDYHFPREIKLTKKMKDYLENEVDQHYYITPDIKSKKIPINAKVLLNVNPSENGINGNVYYGEEAPTITCNKGEGIKIAIKEENFTKKAQQVLDNNKCEIGDTVDAFNQRVNKSGVSPTITTRPEGFKTAILPVVDNLRIRKLTPRECGRLMGVKDETISKMETVNSNCQLYKQFGNSIVVPVLEAIFRNMNIKNVKNWDAIQDQFTNDNPDPICLNSKGGRNGIEGLQPSVQDRIYSTDGTSTAITTAFRPSILEGEMQNA